MRLIDAHSWLPRSRKKFSGYLTCASARRGCAKPSIGLPRSRVAAQREEVSGCLTGAPARRRCAHPPDRQSAAAARRHERGRWLSAGALPACRAKQLRRAQRPRHQHASAEYNKGDGWVCGAAAPIGPLLSSKRPRAGSPCPLRAGSPCPLRAGSPPPPPARRRPLPLARRTDIAGTSPAAVLVAGCAPLPGWRLPSHAHLPAQAAALRSVRARAATPTMRKSLRHARSPTQCRLCCQAFRFARPSPAVGPRAPPAPGWQPLIRSISCRAGLLMPARQGLGTATLPPPAWRSGPGATMHAAGPSVQSAAPRTRARDRAARPALAASGRLLNTSLLAAVWPRVPDASWLAAHAALARSAGANT